MCIEKKRSLRVSSEQFLERVWLWPFLDAVVKRAIHEISEFQIGCRIL